MARIERFTFVAGGQDFAATDIEWSPRGNEIAYTQKTSWLNTYVGMADFDHSPRPFPGFDENAMPYSPAWSPNAEIMGFLYDTPVPTSPEIAAVDLHAGQRTQLTQNDVEEYGLEWSPDGEKIVYSGQTRDAPGNATPSPSMS